MLFLKLIATRIAVAIATLFVVAALIFFGVEALPGDAAVSALGIQSTNKQLLKAAQHRFELDKPAPQRFVKWIGGVVHGDLGTSIPSGQPVSTLVGDRIKNTAVLALLTMLILVPLATFLGILLALRKDTVLDHSVSAGTLTLIATPEFIVGALLAAAFATGLGALPAVSILDASKSVFAQLNLLVLPIATLVLVAVAQATRMIRAATIDVLRSDYIQMAILRGTPRGVLLRRHVLPNALGPTIQVLAFTVAYLVGGIVVVETIFSYPGIGSAIVSAVQTRDIPTVTSLALIVSAVYVFANLLSDVAIIAMNPRLRRAGR